MEESSSWSTTTRYFVLIIVLGVLLWLLIAARELIGPLIIAGLICLGVENVSFLDVVRRAESGTAEDAPAN